MLLGDMGAGKSSLVLRFVKGQFHDYQVRRWRKKRTKKKRCIDDGGRVVSSAPNIFFFFLAAAGNENAVPRYQRSSKRSMLLIRRREQKRRERGRAKGKTTKHWKEKKNPRGKRRRPTVFFSSFETSPRCPLFLPPQTKNRNPRSAPPSSQSRCPTTASSLRSGKRREREREKTESREDAQGEEEEKPLLNPFSLISSPPTFLKQGHRRPGALPLARPDVLPRRRRRRRRLRRDLARLVREGAGLGPRAAAAGEPRLGHRAGGQQGGFGLLCSRCELRGGRRRCCCVFHFREGRRHRRRRGLRRRERPPLLGDERERRHKRRGAVRGRRVEAPF